MIPEVATIIADLPTTLAPMLDQPLRPQGSASEQSRQVLVTQGTGQGAIDPPNRLSLDAEGNIFVADYITGRIQKFDPEGTFIFSWISEGDTPLLSLAVTRDGQVLASRNNGVQVYDGNTGEKIGAIQSGTFGGFENLIVLPDRSMLGIPWAKDALVRLNTEGNKMMQIDRIIAEAGGSGDPIRLAVDGLGKIYILARPGDAVFVYDSTIKFLDRLIIEEGTPFGDIAVAPSGEIYVAAFSNIQIFNSAGAPIGQIDQAAGVHDMQFTDDGDLITVNSAGEVVKYDR